MCKVKMAIPEDEPYDDMDWGPRTLGPRSYGSFRERRSTIWNDDVNLLAAQRARTETTDDWKGKFFPRGCRGMIEQLQVYSLGDAVDSITLNISPHPCIGPLYTVDVIPGIAEGWWAADFEQMWNYDSLFIWITDVEANASWWFDAFLPYDGHESADLGATWEDLAIRPFIRAIYTGETPGDVPVSGIINNIPIPSVSSERIFGNRVLVINVETTNVDILGAGFSDLIILRSVAAPGSHNVRYRIYCDEIQAYNWSLNDLNIYGMTPATPGLSVLQFGANADCVVLITKRFEFRRRLRITSEDGVGGVVSQVTILPTLMR